MLVIVGAACASGAPPKRAAQAKRTAVRTPNRPGGDAPARDEGRGGRCPAPRARTRGEGGGEGGGRHHRQSVGTRGGTAVSRAGPHASAAATAPGPIPDAGDGSSPRHGKGRGTAKGARPRQCRSPAPPRAGRSEDSVEEGRRPAGRAESSGRSWGSARLLVVLYRRKVNMTDCPPLGQARPLHRHGNHSPMMHISYEFGVSYSSIFIFFS